LANGVDILVGQKGDTTTKFRLDSLTSNELNNNDVYIEPQTINKFSVNIPQIKSDGENIYEMNTPIITSGDFKNNDPIFNRNYSVNEISDGELLNQYLVLKTNFDELGD
jgi:hypothetical protein